MFTLLALGTNANAGLPAVMEAYAATPKFSSIYGTKVSGTPAGFIPSRIAKMAKSGLPHRREEIIDSITIGLQHTNAQFVALAAEVASGFPEEFGRWKDLLLKLLEHPAEDAQLAALWIAVTTQPGDSDVMRATEAIARDRDNSVLLRGRAAAGLGFAGARATNSLPVMRKLLQHPDSWLKGEVRTAIEMIEKGRPPINEQQPKQ